MDKLRIDSIYSEILDLPPERRAERLAALCGGEHELKDEVESLLHASERPIGRLDAQFESIRNSYWRDVVGSDTGQDEDLSGSRIGIWRLEARVGRGGIATVYRAAREDGEFTQRAAFKVMRRGLDTDDLISRFRAEREILAALDHPGIAGILDGGTMPDGRPYLVLEFVDGVDIVNYVQQHATGIHERLELIHAVAAALHHAHQHLVVHRDVKPTNVMVTAEGAVRLLDFGIAKILDPGNSPIASRLTRTGIAMLTPAYGSPELITGAPVTTGSDIFQLGLLMAEVLTGHRPDHPPAGAPMPDIKGIEDRDLIAIIQKSTRVVPEERYASARDFAADLERYLGDRPVQARTDSWVYRTRKLLKRHPLLAPIAVGVVATIAIYIGTITAYSRQVERERAVVEQTQDFMIQLFKSPDPRAPADPSRGRSITVVEALDIGMARVQTELEDQPYLQASLNRTISSVYEALDQFRPAIELREKALALEERLYGPDSPRALDSMRTLARLKLNAGDIDSATRLTQRQLDIARDLPAPGPELGFAEHAAGVQAHQLGEDETAAELLRSAIGELLTQEGVDDRIDVAQVMALLEQTSSNATPIDNILSAERLALDALGPETNAGLIMTIRVASSLTNIGAYEAAEAHFLAALPRLEAALGAQHPDVLSARNNLGYLYSAWGSYAQAEAIHRDLLDRNLRTMGPKSQAVAYSYQNLATALARQARYPEALQLHQQALSTLIQVFDDSHYLTALPLISMAYIQLSQEQPALAEHTAADALTRLEQAPQGSALRGIAQCLLGIAQDQQGNEAGSSQLAAAREALAQDPVPQPYADLCGVTPQ